MITNHYAQKYKTPYKVTSVITQCWTNGTVTLQCGAIKIRHKICCIKQYKSDTNFEDITPEIIYDDVNILSPVIHLCIKY